MPCATVAARLSTAGSEAILPPAPGLPYAPLRPAQTLADNSTNLVPGTRPRGRSWEFDLGASATYAIIFPQARLDRVVAGSQLQVSHLRQSHPYVHRMHFEVEAVSERWRVGFSP